VQTLDSLDESMGPAETQMAPFPRDLAKETLDSLDEADDGYNYGPQRAPRAFPPKATKPKPVDQNPAVAPDATKAIADFLGGGPVPFEVINPLATLAKGLAGAGAIGAADVKSVVAFMAKMLRKYVGGQKLARVSTASAARKARLAARASAKTASFTDRLKSHVKAKK
jgi:hypothetical protein